MALAHDRIRDLAPGYVLGALEAAEMAAVREHLAGCTRPHPEVREFGGVVTHLGGSLTPIEPPAPSRLKAAVLAAAQADLRARAASATVAVAASGAAAPAAAENAPVLTVLEPERGGVISFAAARAIRFRRMGVWATRAAAAVVIVGLVGYAVNLQSDLNRQHQAQATANNFYDGAGQPGARVALMSAAGGQRGGGEAALLPSGHVTLLLHGLEPTKGNEVYSVWWSADGGAVTKAGWFTVDDNRQGYLDVQNLPASSTLWLMVCKEPTANETKPGPIVATGTILVYEPPAGPLPTPTV
jgi:hypothetical protein